MKSSSSPAFGADWLVSNALSVWLVVKKLIPVWHFGAGLGDAHSSYEAIQLNCPASVKLITDTACTFSPINAFEDSYELYTNKLQQTLN